MGLFDWLGSDPSKEADKYLKQIPGMAHGIYDPYMQQGQRLGGMLEGQYGQLMGDPGGMLNKIGGGYQQSPGFQFALKQALQAGGNAAAAGGMAGSPMHERANMETATGLANQDYNQWLQNAMGMYGTGLQGAQGMYGAGANAAGNLAGMLGSNLQDRASNAYSGANWRNSMNIGLPLQAAAAYFTGGQSLMPGGR
jgi:hypothetical protein